MRWLGLTLLVCCGGTTVPAPEAGSSDAAAHEEASLASRRVFVTLQPVFIDHVFSPGDADGICNAAAQNAGLGGEWVAWLSTTTMSASARLTHGDVPYKLLNGIEVAPNWAGLTSGVLEHSISLNETGGVENGPVLTGTLADGSPDMNNTCDDWSGTTPLTTTTSMGDSSSTTSTWSASTITQSCRSGLGALYCFEK